MELQDYVRILGRRIRLVILIILLGMAAGFVISRLEKPTYQASTKILVSKDATDQNSQFAAMSNQQLIDAYVQLLSSSSVVDEASRRLNFVINLKDSGTVQQVQSTNVIKITMNDRDPQRAAAIANTLVQVLIDQNTQASTEESIKKSMTEVEKQISTLQAQFDQIADQNVQGQLTKLNGQITAVQDQISKLSAEIGPLDSPYSNGVQRGQLAEKQAQVAQLQSQLAQYQQVRINLEYFGKPTLSSSNTGGDVRLQLLQSTLDNYQKIYLDLLSNLQSVQLSQLRHDPTIEQIEKATPPIAALRPQPVMYTLLGGIIGLVLAIGIAFSREYSANNKGRS